MSRSKQIVGIVLALLLGYGLAWSLANAQAPAPAIKSAVRRAVPTWEYKSTGDAELETLPKEGWELGWVTGDGNGVVYTWKRQKP